MRIQTKIAHNNHEIPGEKENQHTKGENDTKEKDKEKEQKLHILKEESIKDLNRWTLEQKLEKFKFENTEET